MLKKVLKDLLKKVNVWLLIVLIAGVLSWSVTMAKSGRCWDTNCSGGIGFWGANGHDGIWHISLINQLAKGNFEMPTFAGETLKNYHIGFDLFVAAVSRVTGLSSVSLYFQIFPVVLALLIGILTYKFVLLWKKSKTKALWSTFFVYFGASFGWLVNIFRGKGIDGESMFWAQQGISTLINPPFALSIILILLGLIFLIKYHYKPSLYYLVIATLIFGVLIQVKAYAGILVLGGLFVAGIWELRKKKTKAFKGNKLLLVFASSLVISIILYLPLNKNSGQLLMFSPFWFLETMMGLTDRLGWLRFHSAMTTYRFGGIWLKAIFAYSIAFFIFWYGNMGTRLIGEFEVLRWIKNPKKASWIEIFIISVIIAGVIIPMFFLQKGTPWNTIQFFYYSLTFSGIVAGISFGEFIKDKSKLVKIFSSILVIFLTIPTTIGTLNYVYLPKRPPAKLSQSELEGLGFLAEQPEGVVLTYPYDSFKAKEAIANPPKTALFIRVNRVCVSIFQKTSVFRRSG